MDKNQSGVCKVCAKKGLPQLATTITHKRQQQQRNTGLDFSLTEDVMSVYEPQIQKGSGFGRVAGIKRPYSKNMLDNGELEMIDAFGDEDRLDDFSPLKRQKVDKLSNIKVQSHQQQDLPEQEGNEDEWSGSNHNDDDDLYMDDLDQSVNVQQQHHQQHSIVSQDKSSQNDVSNAQDRQYHTPKNIPVHTGYAVIVQLQKIEAACNQNINFSSLDVQDLCHMFTQDCLINYFKSGDHRNLTQCIIEVNNRTGKLSQIQVLGLLAASFTLGQAAWHSSVELLKTMEDLKRAEVLDLFKPHLEKYCSEAIASWCCQYWIFIGQQQLDLIKYLNGNSTTVDTQILSLSTAVTITDHQNFTKASSSFVRNADDSAQLILDSITAKPSQPKLSFNDFIELISILQHRQYSTTIEDMKERLLKMNLSTWANEIVATKETSAIVDADSVQFFIDQLVNSYGEGKTLMQDLTQSSDDRFSMFLQIVSNPPNKRQSALAQYCLGTVSQHPRQLWNVPAGQGKGRIQHTIALFSILLRMFQKVHLVYSSQLLLDRDRQDFATYLLLLNDIAQEPIQYHVGYDFEPQEGELVIVDEADVFIFDNPVEFFTFVAKCACLCFTATPGGQGNDNNDSEDIDAKVVDSLRFEMFHYILDQAKQKVELSFDTVDAQTIKLKADVIARKSKLGPVLVYCDLDLYDELQRRGDLPLLLVDQQVDHEMLRQLDQQVKANQYRVIVATDKFAMRGLDYRSKSVPMALILAKSFENQREAMQGYNRAGRFGDSCTRTCFSDIPIINAEAAFRAKMQGFKFVTQMKEKQQITMKQIKVKEITAPATSKSRQQKNTNSSSNYQSQRLGQNRTNALLLQGQSTLQFTSTNTSGQQTHK